MTRRFFARKTKCALGHTHDSQREAARCAELRVRFRAGEIENLVFHPAHEFVIGGTPVVMANGHRMKFTLDFGYIENGRMIVEDVKPKNGFMSRDVPVKIALFRHLNPDIELRLVK